MVELIVVLVITLIILGAVFSLMRGTIITANTNYEMTAATQGLRNAQEYINRDVLTLGDGAKGLTNIWLPTRFVTEYLTARTAADIDPTNRGYVSVGAVVSDDQVPAGKSVPGTNPATTVLPNTDRASFITEDKSFISISLPSGLVNALTGIMIVPASRFNDFNVGETYFLSNGVSGSFGTVTSKVPVVNAIIWQNGDTLGLNRTGSTSSLASVVSAGLTMNLMRVQLIHYFVDAEGKLIRRVFGAKGALFVDSVIAEHVVDLQFRYVMKPSSDGTILNQPVAQFSLDSATSVRIVEPSVVVETAYPLQDGQYHQVAGVTQLAVRNIQFLEASRTAGQ